MMQFIQLHEYVTYIHKNALEEIKKGSLEIKTKLTQGLIAQSNWIEDLERQFRDIGGNHLDLKQSSPKKDRINIL